MTVNNFDILKRMSAENKDIRLADSGSIIGMQMTKAGTQITIGVQGNVIARILHNELAVCCLVFDRKQFAEIKGQMAMEAEGITEQDIAETMPPKRPE